MAARNKKKKSVWDELAWMEWRKGGKVQVYELARDGNRIRIRTGVKGKKFNSSTVVKDSVSTAQIFFTRQKQEKLRSGKFVLIDKDAPSNPPSAPNESERFQFSFKKKSEKENEDPSEYELPSELDFEVQISDDEDYSADEEDEDEDGEESDEDEDEDDDEEDDVQSATQSPARSVRSDRVRRSLSRDCRDSSSEKRNNTASTASSSSSGRPSDTEYEMDYEQMADLMRRAITKFEKDVAKGKAKMQWKRLKRWIRYDAQGIEHEDKNARYHIVPLLRRIAGSCHELVIIRIRGSDSDELVTRLLKVARDPDEDNAHHFITERRVACRLTKIAKVINRCYNSRTDICVWPVETILFDWQGQNDKWATVQAPFLPRKQSNYCFVKIEPNSGAPCVTDHVVGRYQHTFAAVSRGLDLVRDWQGYGVDAVCFGEECKKYCPEALDQIRPRRSGLTRSTQVLIMIDPVLTTVTAHYEMNNPTDFGMKAIDEWQETHDCESCRCNYFHLCGDLRFGLADPDQKFLNSTAPEYLHRAFAGLRKELNVWSGDDDFDPESYF